MILATVGTHEDQFNRLLVELNRLVEVGAIKERVVVQSGYCDADAPAVECFDQLPFDELQSLMAEANVIITHGGPASIMQAMAHGKVPIVVPRQSKFGEHVDDHQCRFAEKMRERVLVVTGRVLCRLTVHHLGNIKGGENIAIGAQYKLYLRFC
jgi:UDP-N-acetylglucosamine transferase subunit ALG13